MRGWYLVVAVAMTWLVGCGAEQPPDRRTFTTETFALKACPDGEMLDGIDVSKWQGTVNWTSVANDGIDFAFIRVSDGLGYQDAYFQSNWSEAKANGIVRGAYQFFRSDEDPVAQAEYLLDEMGPLEPGDLPPVCDVETADGQSPATIVDRVQTWLDVVEGALGVKPLIYTSPGVWGSIVNSGEFSDYPLWVAHWGATCPTMPTGWSDWVVWQTSDSGSVAGVSGGVDTNQFNGGMKELVAFAYQEGTVPNPPLEPGPDETATPCLVSTEGNAIAEEDGPCARRLSPVFGEMYTDASGHGGHAWLVVGDEAVPKFREGVEWLFEFEAAGAYKVWAHVPAVEQALSSSATFEVVHQSGTTVITVDQGAHVGEAVLLGTFQFDVGAGGQSVRALDSYVEGADEGLHVAFDAIEVGSAALCACTEEGAIETLPCGDGGELVRECDGCQWSDWSACAETVDAHGAGADGEDGEDVGPGGASVQAYTSATRVTTEGCHATHPARGLGWWCLLLWWVVVRRQRPSVASA